MRWRRRVGCGAVLVGALLLLGGSLARGSEGGRSGAGIGPGVAVLGKRPPSPVSPQPQPPGVSQPPVATQAPTAPATPAAHVAPARSPGLPDQPRAEVRAVTETVPEVAPDEPVGAPGGERGSEKARQAPLRQLATTGAGAGGLVALAGAALVLGGGLLLAASVWQRRAAPAV